MNEFEEMILDYFGDQVLGFVGPFPDDIKSEEAEVFLYHSRPSKLFQSIKNMIGDRKFYLRRNGCHKERMFTVSFIGDDPELTERLFYRMRIFLDKETKDA